MHICLFLVVLTLIIFNKIMAANAFYYAYCHWMLLREIKRCLLVNRCMWR